MKNAFAPPEKFLGTLRDDQIANVYSHPEGTKLLTVENLNPFRQERLKPSAKLRISG